MFHSIRIKNKARFENYFASTGAKIRPIKPALPNDWLLSIFNFIFNFRSFLFLNIFYLNGHPAIYRSSSDLLFEVRALLYSIKSSSTEKYWIVTLKDFIHRLKNFWTSVYTTRKNCSVVLTWAVYPLDSFNKLKNRTSLHSITNSITLKNCSCNNVRLMATLRL